MKLSKRIRSAFTGIPLKFSIWMYFIGFILIVFILLWVFQIFFLEKFYTYSKIHDVEKAAAQMTASLYVDSAPRFSENLEKIASENDLCIEVVDQFGRSLYTKEYSVDCVIHKNSPHGYMKKIKDNANEPIWLKQSNPKNNYSMLLYGCALGSKTDPRGYLLVNTSLVPVGSTVSIIKRQLMLITFILILFAFVFTLFLSKHISKPIDKITAAAKNLALGDFKTEFDGRGYLEVRQLADTLTYAEKELSRVDNMQRDLIANVSHDLRTPLTMLKAYAEMIRDLSGDNPVKRNEHLEIIINETDRLSLMVNDILDLSKLESGKQKLEPSEFQISSKLNDIIGRFKGISEKMGYSIHFTPDEEKTVVCDVVKIEQVIYNLINNAINYTGKDKQVFVRQINTSDGIIIEVEDTGEGIEQDKINLIFDKYYRSENHKREVVGTGLGLSIVKAVLKIHGYDYGVRSVLGEGSVFWFKIAGRDVKS